MTWTNAPRRADVLRTVIATADRRRDAVLPVDVPGVEETFADALDLVGALQLRWHTRLAGRIEREQTARPGDLSGAVVRAWIAVADDMPGVRAVLDLARLRPTEETMDAAMGRATAKEHLLLAATAGLAGPHDLAHGPSRGAELEQAARSRWGGPHAAPRRDAATGTPSGRVAARLRALLPA